MTAAVNQASSMAAAGAPAGARNARHAGGSTNGFGDALGALKERSNQAEADGHVKARPGAHPRRNTETMESGAADTRPGNVDVPIDGNGEVAEELLGGAGEGSPETGERDDVDADSDGGGLPTQIKAEQAISAMMAMAPIDHHPRAAADGATGELAADGQVAAGPDLGDHTATQVEDDKRAAKTEVRMDAGASGQPSNRATSPEAGAVLPANATLEAGDAGAMTGNPATGRNATQTGATAAASVEGGPSLATVSGSGKVAGGPAVGRDGTPGGNNREPARADASVASAPSDAAAPSRSPPDLSEGGNGRSDSGSSPSQGRAPEARRGEPQPAAAKVSVLAQQAAPAPAAPQASANATAVVAAIAGEQGWRPSNASADSLQAFRNAQPMRSLKIELRPAELGTVTANLKTAGEQMSVELQVENREAYDRLSADSEAIVKSLRSLGYDIDRVSIQQPQAATTIAQRADASTFAGSFSRDAASFQSGNSGNGSERSGGQTSGHGDRNNGQHGEPAQQIRSDRGGGSVYI